MAAEERGRRPRVVLAMVGLLSVAPASSFAPASPAFLGGAPSVARRGRPSTAHASTPPEHVVVTKRVGKRARVKRVWRRSSLHAAEIKDKLGHGVWDKFKVPPDGRAHDEVTFRSGCEGSPLTIPQGVERYIYVLSCSFHRGGGQVASRPLSISLSRDN